MKALLCGWVKCLLDAFFAGIFIGIAGTVFLASSNPVAGAFLFGLGLLGILCFSLKLYTGAIGYLASQGKNFFRFLFDLLLIWLGNFAGCFTVGTLVRASRTFPGIAAKASAAVDARLLDSPVSLLILSIFCGMLMFAAVDSFRNGKLPAPCRPLMVILCVMVFILSGFEHCIADMYYFSVGGAWNKDVLLLTLWLTLGNSIGGNLLGAHVKLSGALTAGR